jgi:hypothetical protein
MGKHKGGSMKRKCEECGCTDISVTFRSKGEVVSQIYGSKYYNKMAVEDQLHCHCRECGYEWEEEPLWKLENLRGGMQFDPEEPSAVEKWGKESRCYLYEAGINRGFDYKMMYENDRKKGDLMRDELQALCAEKDAKIAELTERAENADKRSLEWAFKCGKDMAEISKLTERAEKAERERDIVMQSKHEACEAGTRENAALKKRIEELEIQKKLAHPLEKILNPQEQAPESPELAQAREAFTKEYESDWGDRSEADAWKDQVLIDRKFIAALETEIEKLKK